MSISVSSVISKIFERVLAPYLISKCVIRDQKLGFQTYRCRASALRLIRKILRHFDYVPTPLYMCSIDIAAAFYSDLLNFYLH